MKMIIPLAEPNAEAAAILRKEAELVSMPILSRWVCVLARSRPWNVRRRPARYIIERA